MKTRNTDTELETSGSSTLTGTNADSSVLRRALSLIDELNTSTTGSVVFKQIERILQEGEAEHVKRESVLLTIIKNFLTTYLKHLTPGSSLHLQVKLIQKQLQQPLSSMEIQSLRKFIDMYLLHMARMEVLDEQIIRNALLPLLDYYGAARKEQLNHSDLFVPVESEPVVIGKNNPLEDLIDELLPNYKINADKDNTDKKMQGEYESYLSEQASKSGYVRSELTSRINETVAKHEQFGVMLEVIRNGLKEANTVDDIEILREALVDDVDGLIDAHKVLLLNLDDAKKYFHMIETDSRHLSSELARVRQLSITDELTGLPNRRAFMRRLDDELGRAQRYNFNLALAMVDLDYFKQINDKYGHPVGDQVLKCYANKLFTIFRQHDLVCRYGGEEFAVLFPNTSEQGALAAMEKVRDRVKQSFIENGHVKIKVPSFSAGLTLFAENDTAATMIQRADEALYNAKSSGRNRTEVVYKVTEDSSKDDASKDEVPKDAR